LGLCEYCSRSASRIHLTLSRILGVTLNIGGGPAASYIGGKYWVDPGAFNNGFRGLCSVFVTAAFAFAGTELVGLAAAETQNPRKTLPNAIKQVFWRITIFYVVALLVVGLIVPYNDPRLLTGHADTSASPFVIAIRNAGIAGLDSVMNAVIMIAVLSVGNSAVFGASRTIAALADQGQAPKILSYVDKRGRPIVAILFAASFGMLAFFVSLGDKAQTTLFTWLLALSGLSSIFTWSSICLAHIRFRKAWRVQGHTLDELAFRSQPGLIGSWIGFVFNILVLAAQFWVGFAPVGYQKNSVSNNVENFFEAFLCLPILLVFYVGYKIAKRTKVVRSRDMDIDTGGRVLNIQEILEEERRERKEWPKWKKVYKFFC
jgi:amino acid transporter